jgi:hypothetical protein
MGSVVKIFNVTILKLQQDLKKLQRRLGLRNFRAHQGIAQSSDQNQQKFQSQIKMLKVKTHIGNSDFTLENRALSIADSAFSCIFNTLSSKN